MVKNVFLLSLLSPSYTQDLRHLSTSNFQKNIPWIFLGMNLFFSSHCKITSHVPDFQNIKSQHRSLLNLSTDNSKMTPRISEFNFLFFLCLMKKDPLSSLTHLSTSS